MIGQEKYVACVMVLVKQILTNVWTVTMNGKNSLYISTKNTKLGNIHSISLPPVKTCAPGVPCVHGCYARRIFRMYPVVREQWQHNLNVYLEDAENYFFLLKEFIVSNEVPYFRFHIGGDCPDKKYADLVLKISREIPKVNFMIFTKRYDYFTEDIPANLSVILSMWPYIKEPQSGLRKSWIRGDLRANGRKLYECRGICEECLYCYSSENKFDILLVPH